MKVTLIAIAGGSGSGKTWLARQLKRYLRPHAAILSLDNFYADLSHFPLAARGFHNFDAPSAIDWALFRKCLEAISRDEVVDLPEYDFATHTRHARLRRWRRTPVVIVEGLWPWWRKELRRFYALRVFRAAPEEIRFGRRLARDVTERGRTEQSVYEQWQQQVQPMYQRFVRPQVRAADVVLPPEAPEWRLARLVRKIRALARLSA